MVCLHCRPNRAGGVHRRILPSLVALSPSPICLSNWMEFVLMHPDHSFASYTHTGLSTGFHIGFNRHATILRSTAKNHHSASENTVVVRDYIKAKTELGHLVGPLPRSSLPLAHTSPIDLVPMSQTNQWCMIVDISSPLHHSVNDGISSELSSVSYASVDDAIGHILCLGRRTQLVKIDLKNAYRIVPIHSQDHHLLAIS